MGKGEAMSKNVIHARRFAANTTVPSERTKAEIEKELIRYGATAFGTSWFGTKAAINFERGGWHIRFMLELKGLTDQETRSRWRALLLVIKAKLEGIECGIETFEESFLSHVVMPDQQTAAAHILPMVREAYRLGAMPSSIAGLLPAPAVKS